MRKNLILKSFMWTVTVTALFSLAIGAAIIAIIVGDWVYLHTNEALFGWLVGAFVLVSFIVSLGVAIGSWLWLKKPEIEPPPPIYVADELDKIITGSHTIQRD